MPDFCPFGADMCVYLGEDGPSQMGLEDLAMFRAIPTATVFYPSDGVSTEKAVELAANTKVLIVICNKKSERTERFQSRKRQISSIILSCMGSELPQFLC